MSNVILLGFVVAAIWIATRTFWTLSAEDLARARRSSRHSVFYWAGVGAQVLIWTLLIQIFYLVLLGGVEITDFRYVSF